MRAFPRFPVAKRHAMPNTGLRNMHVSRLFLALAAFGLAGFSSSAAFAQDAPPRKKKKPPARVAPRKAPPAKTAPKAVPPKVTLPFDFPPIQSTVTPAPFQGLLGVMVGQLTPKRRTMFGAPPTAGILVHKVVPGTLASVAGLKKGDVILDVGGTTTRRAGDVKNALSGMFVGDLLTLQVIRDAEPKTLFATLMPTVLKANGQPNTPAIATLDGNLRFSDAVPTKDALTPERPKPKAKRTPRKPPKNKRLSAKERRARQKMSAKKRLMKLRERRQRRLKR